MDRQTRPDRPVPVNTQTRVDRQRALDRTLAQLMGGDAGRDMAPEAPTEGDPFDLALDALVRVWADDPEGAAAGVARALERARDVDALSLARATAGLVAGMWVPAATDPALRDPVTGGDPIEAAVEDPRTVSAPLRPAIHWLLVEAALGAARLGVAARLRGGEDEPPRTLFGRKHPFLTMLRGTAARLAVFEGDVARAERIVAVAVAEAATPLEEQFALGCAALVYGNADRRLATRMLAARAADFPAPVDVTTRGLYVLAGYGVLALGEAERAAALILTAGGDADLSRLRIIDRAFGLETLVTTALEAGDLDAAESWLARVEPLAEHPIAACTRDRALSRVLLHSGDVDGAFDAAERALGRATAEGRAVEAASAEILRAAARIARDERGDAARDLATLVSQTSERGFLAVRRSAARELRRVGRRLPPVAESGWEGLSPRERDVALLMAQGQSNAMIAAELFLSPHTVRMHVSRVLQAFGAPTRAGVAAILHGPVVDAAELSELGLPALTTRQADVLARIATGASNRQIASELGIRVTTVEKHLAAIMQRWDASSRTALIHLVTRGEPGEAPQAKPHRPTQRRSVPTPSPGSDHGA
jgi:DNA-binding NarL/FixJ family response regulator